MTVTYQRPELLPGDCLIYGPHHLPDWLVAFKTWSRKSVHVEGYIGNGQSVAARIHQGVHVFPVRWDTLTQVRRPMNGQFNIDRAMSWFYASANGQKFDLLGMLVFFLARRHGLHDRMWCSEFLTRWYRHGNLPLFGDYDADLTCPRDFLMTHLLPVVWKRCF